MIGASNSSFEGGQDVDLVLRVALDLLLALLDGLVHEGLELRLVDSVDDLGPGYAKGSYIEHKLPVDKILVDFVRQVVVDFVRRPELLEDLLERERRVHRDVNSLDFFVEKVLDQAVT